MKNKNTRRGFTLIELLVVVLIIGILAAVAVPQYQKAVLKSRFTQVLTNVDALVKAQKVYYLANGTYATDENELDVQITTADNIYCWANIYHNNRVLCQLKKGGSPIVSLGVYLQTGKKSCTTYYPNYKAAGLCADFAGTDVYDDSGCGTEAPCHTYSSFSM